MLLSKLFNKVPVPAIFYRFRPEQELPKIEDPAGTNRPALSSGAPLISTDFFTVDTSTKY